MTQQVGDPFRVFHIGFLPWDCLDMPGIHYVDTATGSRCSQTSPTCDIAQSDPGSGAMNAKE
jgi:hypothetical protein